MKKTVFLDRDGTINKDNHYVYRIEDFEFLDGAVEGMRALCEAGYQLVIVTNQSGIARGYYSESDFHRLNDWMCSELCRQGVIITKVYYCPHLHDAPVEKYAIECCCRKPQPGMFLKAIEELSVDTAHSFVIGDKLRDLAICESTDIRGILISDVMQSAEKWVAADNLKTASDYIINTENKESSSG